MARIKRTGDRILERLVKDELTVEQLAERLGKNNTQIHSALRRLIQAGKVWRVGDERPAIYTAVS